MYRVFLLVLLLVLIGLQYRLWFGEGGIRRVSSLGGRIEKQRLENEKLYERNSKIATDIVLLRQEVSFIEELARVDLGMVKEEEDFYLLYENK